MLLIQEIMTSTRPRCATDRYNSERGKVLNTQFHNFPSGQRLAEAFRRILEHMERLRSSPRQTDLWVIGALDQRLHHVPDIGKF
jgi:hypothetical protein